MMYAGQLLKKQFPKIKIFQLSFTVSFRASLIVQISTQYIHSKTCLFLFTICDLLMSTLPVTYKQPPTATVEHF